MSQAKIIIKAQDKTKDGINSAKKNLKGLNDVASSLGINLGKLASTGAVVAGFTALVKGAKDCTEAFLKTENTFLTLKSTLSDTKSYDKAINSIDKLSKYTLSSKEDVTKLYTELAQLGKSDTEINKIIDASISLANVTGKSLTESFNVMLDSLDGNTGTLQKYLPEVKGLTKEELALGKAVDATNKAFSETAKSISIDSYSQQIKNIKDDVLSISEDIGYIIMDSLGPVLEWVADFIGDVQEDIANWRKTIEGNKSIDQILQGYSKDSVEYAIGRGYKGGGTQWYAQQTINSEEDASNAYYFLKLLKDNGLLEGEKAQLYQERILTLIREYLPNIEDIKDNLKSSNSSTTTEDPLAEGRKIFSSLIEGYYQTMDRQGIATLYGSNYGKEDNEAQKIAHDMDIAFNRVYYFNEVIESLISGVIETVVGLTDISLDEANKIANDYIAQMESEVHDHYEKYNTTKASVHSKILGSVTSGFTSFGQNAFDTLYNENKITELEELIAEAKGFFGENSNEMKILVDALDVLKNNIDLDLENTVKSAIVSNTAYLSSETKRTYEIEQKEKDLEESREQFNRAIEQMNLGYGEYSEAELKAMDEIIKGLEKELEALKNPSMSYKGMTFSSVYNSVSDYITDAFNNQEAVDNSLINNLTSGFDSLLSSVGSLADIFMSSNPSMALLMELVTEICEDLSPLISEIIKPLNNVLSNVAQLLIDSILPILEPLAEVVGGIAEVMMSLIAPLLNSIVPILSFCTVGLKVFASIIDAVSIPLKFLATVFDYVGTAIEWSIGSFLNWLSGLNLFGWHPFGSLYYGELESPNWDKSKERVDGYSDSVYTSSEDTSTSTSVSTASYTGANNYYFNIYQQAPVVGDGGMQEFAMMIKKEFAELAYMGA